MKKKELKMEGKLCKCNAMKVNIYTHLSVFNQWSLERFATWILKSVCA